jgi:hypothetical protein
MRRKPLFPPPETTVVDPVTRQPVTKRQSNKGRQKTSALTVNGRVELRRRWWHSPTEGSSAPSDALVNARDVRVTAGVVEMAARLNNDAGSHDRAAENLFRTAQVRMSGEQLRQVVHAAGRVVLAAQRAGTVPTAFRAGDCPVDPRRPSGPTRMYVGLDGVMVPTITEAEKVKRREGVKRKRQRSGKRCRPLPPRRQGTDERFKEFKVVETGATVAFHDETKSHWHVSLTRAKWAAVGPWLRREAGRLDFAAAGEKLAVVDGAPRIRTQLEADPHALPLDGLGLDFFHLKENVQKSRRIAYGEDSAAGRAWRDQLLHTFKHEGYEPAYESLLAWRAPLRGRKRKEANRLLDYVHDRRDMIAYPAFAERGWPLGSGPTESRCKTATSRLKGRGRRWDPPNAEAVAALTNLRDSDQWHLFWTSLTPPTT